MLLYAFVILFNFSIFLNVFIEFQLIVLVTFFICKSLWIKASAKGLKRKVNIYIYIHIHTHTHVCVCVCAT